MERQRYKCLIRQGIVGRKPHPLYIAWERFALDDVGEHIVRLRSVVVSKLVRAATERSQIIPALHRDNGSSGIELPEVLSVTGHNDIGELPRDQHDRRVDDVERTCCAAELTAGASQMLIGGGMRDREEFCSRMTINSLRIRLAAIGLPGRVAVSILLVARNRRVPARQPISIGCRGDAFANRLPESIPACAQ